MIASAPVASRTEMAAGLRVLGLARNGRSRATCMKWFAVLRVDTWQTGVAVLREPAEKEVDGRGSDSQTNTKPLSTAFLEPVALKFAKGARIASHSRVP